MKNKKMVATIASLCLVVVAVVAAVVGVLAAVTQTTSSSFSVTYVAKNVYATVSLQSIGPKKVLAEQVETGRAISALSSASSVHFQPTENSQTKNVTADAYDYGWSDLVGGQNAEFLGYSVYQFHIENESTLNPLAVSFTETVGTNLTVKYYYSASAIKVDEFVLSGEDNLVTATWGTDGALATSTFALDGGTDATLSALSADNGTYSLASNIAVTDDAYIYVLVGVTNTGLNVNNQSIALSFTLVAQAAA